MRPAALGIVSGMETDVLDEIQIKSINQWHDAVFHSQIAFTALGGKPCCLL